MSCKQTVTGNASTIPDNFVPLASFGARQSGSRGSDEYEWLLDAYQTGSIDAVKVMRTPRDKCGPVYVNAAQAALVIDERRRWSAGSQPAPDYTHPRPQADAATVAKLLERIAYALECIREAMPQRESSWNGG
jgi:hypothetical protein